MDKPKRAALYLRVSTDHQNTDNQRQVLLEVAARKGWTIADAHIYEDIASGSCGREKRPQFDAMLKDATRGRFDVLMFAAIDRVGRRALDVLQALNDLDHAGVAIYADREGMDTSTAMGKAIMQIMASLAELELSNIRSRVKAGLDRVKAEQASGVKRYHKGGVLDGQLKKPIGRQKLSPDKLANIQSWLADREKSTPPLSMRRIAEECGVSFKTVYNIAAIGSPSTISSSPASALAG